MASLLYKHGKLAYLNGHLKNTSECYCCPCLRLMSCVACAGGGTAHLVAAISGVTNGALGGGGNCLTSETPICTHVNGSYSFPGSFGLVLGGSGQCVFAGNCNNCWSYGCAEPVNTHDGSVSASITIDNGGGLTVLVQTGGANILNYQSVIAAGNPVDTALDSLCAGGSLTVPYIGGGSTPFCNGSGSHATVNIGSC